MHTFCCDNRGKNTLYFVTDLRSSAPIFPLIYLIYLPKRSNHSALVSRLVSRFAIAVTATKYIVRRLLDTRVVSATTSRRAFRTRGVSSNLRRIRRSCVRTPCKHASDVSFCRGNSSSFEIGGETRPEQNERKRVRAHKQTGNRYRRERARSFRFGDATREPTGCPHRRTVSRAYDLIKFNMTRSLARSRPHDRSSRGDLTSNGNSRERYRSPSPPAAASAGAAAERARDFPPKMSRRDPFRGFRSWKREYR